MAAELTRQLLAYSGKGTTQKEAINLNQLITSNLELLATAMPKKVRLESKLADDLPNIEADAGQMQQVIMNLIINAAEAYEGQAGTVFVTTETKYVEAHDNPAYLAKEPLRPGHYIYLSVSDKGKGMDEATQARIFDPFLRRRSPGADWGYRPF